MNETPSPYDVWAAEEALKLVEEATAQRCTPSVGRCQEQAASTRTKPAPFVPTSDAFSPFVRHFSKSGQFAFGLPEKVEPDRLTSYWHRTPCKTLALGTRASGMPIVSTPGYVRATCINCY
jgi:hypothetical protein